MKYLIVHHTVTPRDKTDIAGLIKDHKKRFGRVFYHVIIAPTGVVYRRGFGYTNYRGKGKQSVDIALTGDFTKEGPHMRQLELLREIAGEVGFDKVIGHRDALGEGLRATKSVCPAFDFVKWTKPVAKSKKTMYGYLGSSPYNEKDVYFVRGNMKNHVSNGPFLERMWTWAEVKATIPKEKFDALETGEPVGFVGPRGIINKIKRLFRNEKIQK